MSCLLSGYWDIYKKKIFQTQFLPYICYMIGIHVFLMSALRSNGPPADLYMPLFAFCFFFIYNQAKCEIIQWRNCKSHKDYFLDYWNVNDLVYLILNTFVLTCNFFSLISLEN